MWLSFLSLSKLSFRKAAFKSMRVIPALHKTVVILCVFTCGFLLCFSYLRLLFKHRYCEPQVLQTNCRHEVTILYESLSDADRAESFSLFIKNILKQYTLVTYYYAVPVRAFPPPVIWSLFWVHEENKQMGYLKENKWLKCSKTVAVGSTKQVSKIKVQCRLCLCV